MINNKSLIYYIWLVITILLSISGLSSIVDGIIQWKGIFLFALEQYHTYIRGPALSIINYAIPFNFHVPKWLIDYFIVMWSAIPAAHFIKLLKPFPRGGYLDRYLQNAEEIQSPITGCWLYACRIVGTIILVPFVPIISALVIPVALARKEYHHIPALLVYFIPIIFFMIVVMLIAGISYQIYTGVSAN